MENEIYKKKLTNVLLKYYDIYEDFKLEDEKFDLYAKYFERSERYVLSKAAVVYAMEANLHIFYKYFEEDITLEYMKNFIEDFSKNVQNLVDAHSEHMSTNFILIVGTNDDVSEDVCKYVNKFNYYKSFLFGLKGWMNVGVCIINLDDGKLICKNKIANKHKDSFYFDYNS